MKSKRILFTILQGVLLATLHADAVIIAGGDGSGHTVGTGIPGWSHVGHIDHPTKRTSVTYAGNNWFLTAYHVKHHDNPSGVLLDGTSYRIDPASWTRVTNQDGSGADLVLFRVKEPVEELDDPVIASRTPGPGTLLILIGNGRNRATERTHWTAEWEETDDPAEAAYSGYKWASGSTKRYGFNVTVGARSVPSPFGETVCFATPFGDRPGQAQGATYDSGGGVFTGTPAAWELAGIIITVTTHNGQPGSTAVFGNHTWIADLSVYREQILDTIRAFPLQSAPDQVDSSP